MSCNGPQHFQLLLLCWGGNRSRVTKVPLSELHRVFIVTESPSVMKKKDGSKGRARSRERWREHTQGTLRMSMDGMTMEDKCERFEPCGMWCEHVKTMQLQTACSVLNAAICASLRASRYSRCCPQCAHRCWKCACSRTHFSVAFVIVICSWISVSGGIVTDIFTINFAFNSCWDSYRKWMVAHWIHRLPRSISGHPIFVVNSHNRTPTSLFAIATMRRNFVITFHISSCPPLSWGGTMSDNAFLKSGWCLVWHRIEIHHVRPNPPVATVDVNFCLGGNMTVIFACKPIHLKDDLFRASQLNHRLPEGLVDDESVVDVVIFLLAAFPLKLICRMVLFASRCFPIPRDHVAGPSWCRSSGCRRDPARTRCTSCFLLYHLPWGVHMYSTQFLHSNA